MSPGRVSFQGRTRLPSVPPRHIYHVSTLPTTCDEPSSLKSDGDHRLLRRRPNDASKAHAEFTQLTEAYEVHCI